MGKDIVAPPDVQRIFGHAGEQWTPAERQRVWEWLYEDEPLRRLLILTAQHLGYGTTAQDAEDTWSEFQFRLKSVFQTYEPGQGLSFWRFLLLCLKRFCWDKGEQIRKREGSESSLTNRGEAAESGPIEIEIEDDDVTGRPEDALDLKEQRQAVRKCLRELSSDYRHVIVKNYFEERSIAEIAVALGASHGSVKTRLCRARQKLAECLDREGCVL